MSFQWNFMMCSIKFKSKMFLLAMTTIPPRASSSHFLDCLKRLRDSQTRPFHKLFLTIPRAYRRFPGTGLDKTVLEALEGIEWIDVIHIEEDHGPASKFLGPLLHRRQEVMEATGMIVIDDDRDYAPTMVERYEHFFRDHPSVAIATGNQELYFHRLLYPTLGPDFLDIRPSRTRRVSGFMSFGISSSTSEVLDDLCCYTLQVLKAVPESFYHDEGILWVYLHARDLKVYNINHPFVASIEEEAPQALCENTPTPRAQIEDAVLRWTNSNVPLYFGKRVSLSGMPQTRLQRKLRWG